MFTTRNTILPDIGNKRRGGGRETASETIASETHKEISRANMATPQSSAAVHVVSLREENRWKQYIVYVSIVAGPALSHLLRRRKKGGGDLLDRLSLFYHLYVNLLYNFGGGGGVG